MKLVAVSMVKDEADVIEHTVKNLFRQGIDEMLILDNLSTDGTSDLLASLARDYPISIELDPEVGYYQSRKMTSLASAAFASMGADIVVPFDADEYWTGVNQSLRVSLLNSPYDITAIPLVNYFGTSADDASITNPFERITSRDKNFGPLPKVAVRNVPGLIIEQGNHGASGKGRKGKIETALIGHFPWRSYDQFERKIQNGYWAYLKSDLPESMGGHWRSYGKLLQDHGSEALREHYMKWFENPTEVDLVNRPVYKEYE